MQKYLFNIHIILTTCWIFIFKIEIQLNMQMMILTALLIQGDEDTPI